MNEDELKQMTVLDPNVKKSKALKTQTANTYAAKKRSKPVINEDPEKPSVGTFTHTKTGMKISLDGIDQARQDMPAIFQAIVDTAFSTVPTVLEPHNVAYALDPLVDDLADDALADDHAANVDPLVAAETALFGIAAAIEDQEVTAEPLVVADNDLDIENVSVDLMDPAVIKGIAMVAGALDEPLMESNVEAIGKLNEIVENAVAVAEAQLEVPKTSLAANRKRRLPVIVHDYADMAGKKPHKKKQVKLEVQEDEIDDAGQCNHSQTAKALMKKFAPQ